MAAKSWYNKTAIPNILLFHETKTATEGSCNEFI